MHIDIMLHMWSWSGRSGVAGIAALAVAGALFSSLSSSQAANSPWPGLAPLEPNYGWLGTAQNAATETKKAKQWARVPMSMVAAAYSWTNSPDTYHGQPAVLWQIFTKNTLVSPDGAPHNYGLSVPIKVRTVAFGNMPAEAVIQVSQRRDAHGVPIPLEVVTNKYVINFAESHFLPVSVQDSLAVNLLSLSVDGVDMGVPESGCRTSSLARFDVKSEPYDVPAGADEIALFDVKKNFNGNLGGTLYGTIDIPSFGPCVANGEDISKVLTAMVSGPGNPMSIRVGAPSCYHDNGGYYTPPGPGEDTPTEANCQDSGDPRTPSIPGEIPYPPR